MTIKNPSNSEIRRAARRIYNDIHPRANFDNFTADNEGYQGFMRLVEDLLTSPETVLIKRSQDND